MRSGALNRPFGGPGGDVRVHSTLLRTQKRGDQVFYCNSILRYRRNWVVIRSILVSPISPLPHYEIRPNLISTESYVHEESNGVGCEEFG